MDSLIGDVTGDVALVLAVSWVLSAAARRCRQPGVIGQILAGILLGPTLLGRLPGHLTSRLFPPASLPSLTVLSQVAIVIFMFVVGYELDLRPLCERRRAVPLVAAGALLVPMGLGCGAAMIFRSRFAVLGQSDIGRPFVVFMGLAMSITALPVLAAIVRERDIAGSAAGATATGAAAIMDVAAWLVLAVTLANRAHKPGRPWPVVLVLFVCFVAVMLLAVRPALRWWIGRPQSLLSNRLAVAMTLALGSAWVTASLGLHPVFGGFLAGLTMPRAAATPDADVLQHMEKVAGLLLPLFFVVTGLTLNVGTLDGGAFVLLALVCAIASIGKLGPAYLASRVSRLAPRDAATVALLVNTRGLTELIALNVALSAGLIGPRLFTVLVLMALIMTALTGPLLSLIRAPNPPPASERCPVEPPPSAVGEPASGCSESAAPLSLGQVDRALSVGASDPLIPGAK